MGREFMIQMFVEMKKIMTGQKMYLIELDSVVGDGDLGLTMSDGFTAASETLNATCEEDIGKLLYQAGKVMSTAVPSTMGTLVASGWMQAGKAMKGKTEVRMDDLCRIFEAFEEGVQNRGKAKIGEKTILDGLHPAVEAMRQAAAAGQALTDMCGEAKRAAQKGFERTACMMAVHGRAATRGEASRELLDPGAAVAVLMMKALQNTAQTM